MVTCDLRGNKGSWDDERELARLRRVEKLPASQALEGITEAWKKVSEARPRRELGSHCHGWELVRSVKKSVRA